MTNEQADAAQVPTVDGVSEGDKDRFIQIWAKAVETQMHFNEMSAKSRQLGLTFVAASLGVAIVALSRGDDFALSLWYGLKLHVGVMLILAAALALWGVRRLDLNVYHRMLRGAVSFGEDFEKNYMSKLFDLDKGMTQAISHFSRHSDAQVDKAGSRYVYLGGDQVTAETKIKQFYNYTTRILIASVITLFLITNFGGESGDEVALQPAATELSAPPPQAEMTPKTPNEQAQEPANASGASPLEGDQ